MLHAFQHFFAPIPHRGLNYYGHLVIGLALVFAILAALQAAPRSWRKGIIAFSTFLGGLYFAAEFFLPAHGGSNALTDYQPFVANLSAVVNAFAIGLGVISLLQLHTRNVARRRAGWGYSVVLLATFVSMTVFGLMNEYSPNVSVIPAVPGAWASQNAHGMFQLLFIGGFSNLGAATFSMIAFYIASAAYRAFRIRSLEATLLMVAALIVMLGSVGFGTLITSHVPSDPNSPVSSFRIEKIAQWLMLEVNAPAQRGILFGLTLGLLATALRYWLSLERGAYFDKEL